MSELALPGPLRNPWVRRLLAPAAFVATFALMVYLTFPFDTVAERLESEARTSGWELSIEKLGPVGLLGVRARGLSVKQSTDLPGAAPLELKLDRLDLKPELLGLLLRRIEVGFALESFGGEARGLARISSDPKVPGLSALSLDASEIDLKQLPPSLVQDLELIGRLVLKCDLSSLTQLEAASGTASISLKGVGVVKGTLKLGEGMSFPLPKVVLGEVNGSITIDKGTAKLDRFTVRGGDLEADVDGTIQLKPLFSLSQAALHVRLKPTDKWLEQNPLIKSSMGFLGPKGEGGYTFTVSGPLSRLKQQPGRF